MHDFETSEPSPGIMKNIHAFEAFRNEMTSLKFYF